MNIFALVTFVAVVIAFVLGHFVPNAVREARRDGKVRIFWCDPDSALFEPEFLKRNGNEVTVGKGLKARTHILEARARWPGPYPTWVVHPRHGWNFMPLSDAETIHRDALLQRLAISNPASYHNAITLNKPRQGFRANDPDDMSWVSTAVIVGGAVLGILLLGVGFLVFSGMGG